MPLFFLLCHCLSYGFSKSRQGSLLVSLISSLCFGFRVSSFGFRALCFVLRVSSLAAADARAGGIFLSPSCPSLLTRISPGAEIPLEQGWAGFTGFRLLLTCHLCCDAAISLAMPLSLLRFLEIPPRFSSCFLHFFALFRISNFGFRVWPRPPAARGESFFPHPVHPAHPC